MPTFSLPVARPLLPMHGKDEFCVSQGLRKLIGTIPFVPDDRQKFSFTSIRLHVEEYIAERSDHLTSHWSPTFVFAEGDLLEEALEVAVFNREDLTKLIQRQLYPCYSLQWEERPYRRTRDETPHLRKLAEPGLSDEFRAACDALLKGHLSEGIIGILSEDEEALSCSRFELLPEQEEIRLMVLYADVYAFHEREFPEAIPLYRASRPTAREDR